MTDDRRMFDEEMAGVNPLQLEGRVVLNKRGSSEHSYAARRAAALASAVKHNYLSASEVDLLDPYSLLEYRCDGVQNGVFRKFKQGKYALEARLDLHKMTVDQARREVFEFIHDAEEAGLRTVMIVHGRGLSSSGKAAVLKSYVNVWLPEFASVLGFCSAQPREGGAGAVYVMLKKSEQKKQQNRERYSGGRI